jgi:enamine deaminase RidA (YjgF/YER057c/UK114 family)
MANATIEERLAALGIVLPAASNPAANYTNVVQAGGLLFVSGKGPLAVQGVYPKGKLGREYTTEEGYQFARSAGIQVLAVVKEALGSLDQVRRVVRIHGAVNAEPHFEEHHKVLNGCSDLMAEVFGERGVHARSVTGVVSLRDNLPIVVESIFEV